jgi:hypothetical protein
LDELSVTADQNEPLEPSTRPATGRPKLNAFITKILARQSWHTFLAALGMLLVFMVGMTIVQFATPDMPDNDGFYHIKLAQIMRLEGLIPAFPWLPLSILNAREFSDHHFLFHIALIPFTFGDLRLGAKWASVVFASLAFLSVWWLFHRQRLPYAFLWALGLMGVSEAFLFRMSIARAQSLSLAFLALGLNLLLEKKYRWLLPLTFVYVWLYDAFPLILLVCAAYVLAMLLIDRRLELRPLVYAGLGISLGLLINPYFPDNLVFLFRHLAPKLAETTTVSVGSEWYPYSTSQIMKNSPLALLAFLSGVLALGLSGRRMDVRTAASLFLAAMFGLMLFQARRFVEYFPAFALIFTAFAWTPVIKARLFMPERRPVGRGLVETLERHISGLILALVLVIGLWVTIPAAQGSLRTSAPYDLYARASAWLAANTSEGERVFQTDWDDFPRLFFYNSRNTYLVGLDPTYLQLYNPDLYSLWVDTTQGKVERPSQVISNRFGARYVISDLKHRDFLSRARDDPSLIEVYQDYQAVIFQVIQRDS